MLHCVFALTAGFIPTATKHCSAAIPFARSAVGPYATAPIENVDLGVDDDVERRFQDMENAKTSAPVENAKASAPVESAKASAPVAALMEKHAFPLGLAQRAVASAKSFPIRLWIVDNSGSMGIPDGQKLAKDSTGTFKMIKTTRWQELLKDIEDVGTLSQTVGSRTEFYPINPLDSPPLVVTGEGRSGEVAAVCAGLGAPHSSTPLAETTKRVADKIAGMVEQSLIMPGEKACVVIATDGEPNDKAAFKREVERLCQLPVWLVFRVCTNDDGVIDYYNELDGQSEKLTARRTTLTEGLAAKRRCLAPYISLNFVCQEHALHAPHHPPILHLILHPCSPCISCAVEANIEVIDDLQGEAQEIAQAGNTFVTYGPPMQLARVRPPLF